MGKSKVAIAPFLTVWEGEPVKAILIALYREETPCCGESGEAECRGFVLWRSWQLDGGNVLGFVRYIPGSASCCRLPGKGSLSPCRQ